MSGMDTASINCCYVRVMFGLQAGGRVTLRTRKSSGNADRRRLRAGRANKPVYRPRSVCGVLEADEVCSSRTARAACSGNCWSKDVGYALSVCVRSGSLSHHLHACAGYVSNTALFSIETACCLIPAVIRQPDSWSSSVPVKPKL